MIYKVIQSQAIRKINNSKPCKKNENWGEMVCRWKWKKIK